MKKLLKNRKALGKIGSIIGIAILIAFIIAVSILGVMWLGTLPRIFRIEVIEVSFPARNIIVLTINNTGNGVVNIRAIYINDIRQDTISPRIDVSHPIFLWPGSLAKLNITYTWTPQYNQQIKIVFTEGGPYYKDVVAPAG